MIIINDYIKRVVVLDDLLKTTHIKIDYHRQLITMLRMSMIKNIYNDLPCTMFMIEILLFELADMWEEIDKEILLRETFK